MTSPGPTTAPRGLGPDWAAGAAWMDGAYMPIGEAKISVLDWGFIHSDVTYDVVSVWDGAFFRLDDHLERFAASMATLRFSPRETREEMADILHGCVARAGLEASYVAMVCTRGMLRTPGSRDPRDCENRFFAYALPFIWVIPREIAAQGARIYAPRDVRRIAPEAVDPEVKNYHWGDFTRALLAAKDQGFDNAMLLDAADNVTEGPGFNVFVVKGDRLVTPDAGALMGVTRRTVLELAPEVGLAPEIRPLPFEELNEADEVFMATTGGGVTPVREVNGRVFSNGAPGARTLALLEAYQRLRASGRYATPVRYDLGAAA